jgi:hypothetical protein
VIRFDNHDTGLSTHFPNAQYPALRRRLPVISAVADS